VNNIEVIIVLLLLVMAVPDFCRKIRRPALAYSIFVLFGILLGRVVNEEVATMLQQAGYVGFLLLLFEVGLEIDLPPFREFLPPLRYAAIWAAAQFPVAILLGLQAGLEPVQACLGAAALGGCSVGIAHSAWKVFPLEPPSVRDWVLHVMVALEMLSIVTLALGTAVIRQGLTGWILLRLLGIVVVIYLITRFAVHLAQGFQRILTMTTHWRLHWLALLILAVCAVGNRLGLDSAKTAFVLGLTLSRTRHHGMNLESILAPISRRFLIPLFFVSLGLQLKWTMLWGLPALLALGTAGLLLGLREILHRRWLPSGAAGPVYLLFSPNLTLVALAATVLLEYARSPHAAAWLLVTGLLMTVPSVLLLPPGEEAGGGEP
jgi:Kef-type K+ transport system membrane component KefB